MGPGLGADTALMESDAKMSCKKTRQRAAWRVTVLYGIGVAVFVLVTNIVVLAWANISFPLSGGIATVYTGPCKTSRIITIWVDLAINGFSTLLLAASNNCAQILSSPTRAEITSAHSRMKWLDIGVPSVRNLAAIPRWRACLWAVLFASSIPLHFMYNSSIFSARQANDWNAFAVTADFQNTGLGHASEWISESAYETAEVMYRNISSLTRIDSDQCRRNYRETAVKTKWRNFLIVTDAPLPSGESIASVHTGKGLSMIGPWWECDSPDTILEAIRHNNEQYILAGLLGASSMFELVNYTTRTDPALVNPSECDLQTLTAREDGPWSVWLSRHYNITDPLIPYAANGRHRVKANYCLAEATGEFCSILISTNLLWIVIACNAIKLLCFGTITRVRSFVPLVTIGDAIESFLNHPEEDTAGAGPLSAWDVRKRRLASRKLVEYRTAKRTGQARAGVASRSRWIFCLLICMSLLIGGIALYERLRPIRGTWTFGSFDTDNVLRFSLSLPLIVNVMLANTPQVAVSLAYIFYNNILTCMIMAGEFARFATTRKSLRVSRPKGTQRSTFWLTVPYKWSISMLSASAILHWLVARSLFYVQIDAIDPHGNRRDPSKTVDGDDFASGITGLVYSPGATVAALVLWGVFILVLAIYSGSLLPLDVPVVGSNSIALSAACHRPRTDVHAATLSLQYGIFTEEDGGVMHEKVGFSSESVTTLDRLLPYYEYDSGGPSVEPATKSDRIAEFFRSPEKQQARRARLVREAQKRKWAQDQAQRPDILKLLAKQDSSRDAEQYDTARRELENELEQRYGPYGRARQGSSARMSDEVELLPISSSLEDSRHGKASAVTVHRDGLEYFEVPEWPEVYIYR
ncbi:hypothetical protein CKM354_001132100 [Cercospora kikuchii]|uniref:DUF6536 domain-containing protein n=1 Tax=Cercospora kikuchii TaxID=84275 RepID=A0A9P3D077_9PEZI|nr:uncharacterized protein CKM354_001132100 [Cercospora kikuchii]GIZ48253.1 hypothetical protein CKM354_001132100 [Cercospora kikuchii]